MKELEFHPYANLFPLIEGAAFAELVNDIADNGLREPIVLFEGKILDGRNRYRAALQAGVIDARGKATSLEHHRPTTRQFAISGIEGDPLAWVISANLHRRHLDDGQRAMVAARLANMGHGGKRAPWQDSDQQAANWPVEATATEPAPVTQAQAAGLLNTSERAVRRAKAVVEHGAPELVAKADAGAIAVSVAADLAKLPVEDQREVLRSADPGALYRVIKDQRDAITAQKKVKRAEKVKALGAKQRALPAKKYGVIYADPEWEHLPWSEQGQNKAAANHYPVSSTAVIKARPVRGIAADDCVLFMWTTVPHLAVAFEVVAAWGFTYRSSAVWKKIYPGKQQGLGYWFRVNHEILIVATRGNVPAPAPGTQWGSVIEAPVGEHSEKPAAVYDLIEQYFGELPKIELNARKARPGWDAWGLEAPEAEEGEPPLLRPGVVIKASYGGRNCVILSASEQGGFWSLVCDDATSASLRGEAFYNELTIVDGVVSDPHGDRIEIVGFDPIAADVLAERARRGDGGRYRVFDDYGRTSEKSLQALKAAVESGLVAWKQRGDCEFSTIIGLGDGSFESPGQGTHHGAYASIRKATGLHLTREGGVVEVTGYWDGATSFSLSTMPYAKVNAFLGKLAKWRPAPPPAPADDVDEADIPAFLRRDPDTAEMFPETAA